MTHPHLPPPIANLSVWQRTVRSHPLLNAGAADPLPATADIVIIGGGICGAVLAHSLVNGPDKPRVVLLEARELASGASGRNAGHCRPDAARGFTKFASLHGAKEARHILESEADVLARADAFIKHYDVDCEWTLRKTYDACLTPEFKRHTEIAAQGLRNAGGTPAMDALEGAAAAAETRTPAPAAFKWDAATVNPAKLTLGVHQIALDESGGRYKLFAWTPVHSVTGSEGAWSVNTPRGAITAPKVVFATNGYTGAVLPELAGLVTPIRAQAHKLSPAPAGAAAFPPLEASYSLRYSPEVFYSVAPRPDGSVVLGASRIGDAPGVAATTEDTVDDAAWHPTIAARALATFPQVFSSGGWVAPSEDELAAASEAAARGSVGSDTPLEGIGGRGFEYAWTGTIAVTPDAVPFVGAVPGKPGQYAALGYNGHGMARIFLCAPVLAEFMRTGEWDPAMPASFRLTPERVARLRAPPGAETARL